MSWLFCRKSAPPKNEKSGLEKARDLDLITEKERLKLHIERAEARFARYLDLEKSKLQKLKKKKR